MKSKTNKIIAIALAILMFLGTFSCLLYVVVINKKQTFSEITNLTLSENLQAWYDETENSVPQEGIELLFNSTFKPTSKTPDNPDGGTGITFYDSETNENISITLYTPSFCEIDGIMYKYN